MDNLYPCPKSTDKAEVESTISVTELINELVSSIIQEKDCGTARYIAPQLTTDQLNAINKPIMMFTMLLQEEKPGTIRLIITEIPEDQKDSLQLPNQTSCPTKT